MQQLVDVYVQMKTVDYSLKKTGLVVDQQMSNKQYNFKIYEMLQ